MTTIATSIHRRLMREEEPEWIVWALVIVLLVAGLLVKNAVQGRTESFSADGVSLSYPATWTRLTGPDQLLFAGDPFSSAQAPTGVIVRQMPLAEMGRNLSSLSDLALAWTTRQGRELQAFRSLSVEPTTVNGQEAVMVEYAYVPQGGAGRAPAVARARDYLLRQGDALTIITLAADANAFEAENNTWQAILATVSVR
ncbi:MAG: hypothetical protein ACE5H9_11375 [Anaerolineae bacterium]